MSRDRISSDEKLERLQYVAGLMVRGEYERGVTDSEIAEEYGVALSTAQGYTSEASRLVRALIDPEMVRNRLAQLFDKGIAVVDDELAQKDGDRLAAVKLVPALANGYADLVGASKTDKSASVTVNNVQLEVQIRAALSIGIEVVQRLAPPELAEQIVAEWAKLLPGGDEK